MNAQEFEQLKQDFITLNEITYQMASKWGDKVFDRLNADQKQKLEVIQADYDKKFDELYENC